MHPCFLWEPGVCVVPWRRGHWAQAPPVLRRGGQLGAQSITRYKDTQRLNGFPHNLKRVCLI